MSEPLLGENKYQTDRQTDNNSLADTVDLDSLPIPRFVDPASRQPVQRSWETGIVLVVSRPVARHVSYDGVCVLLVGHFDVLGEGRRVLRLQKRWQQTAPKAQRTSLFLGV